MEFGMSVLESIHKSAIMYKGKLKMTNHVKWIARCEAEYLTLFFGGSMVNGINLARAR
jgi:hypothetical protein